MCMHVCVWVCISVYAHCNSVTNHCFRKSCCAFGIAPCTLWNPAMYSSPTSLGYTYYPVGQILPFPEPREELGKQLRAKGAWFIVRICSAWLSWNRSGSYKIAWGHPVTVRLELWSLDPSSAHISTTSEPAPGRQNVLGHTCCLVCLPGTLLGNRASLWEPNIVAIKYRVWLVPSPLLPTTVAETLWFPRLSSPACPFGFLDRQVRNMWSVWTWARHLARCLMLISRWKVRTGCWCNSID